MAFTTVTTALSTGLYLMVPGNLQNGAGGIWRYESADNAETIYTTGYFKGQGVHSRGGSPAGLALGDLVMAIQTIDGDQPGRVTWHSVVTSTANGSTLGSTYGFDCSVSSAATT
jgi:hypothetical protein